MNIILCNCWHPVVFCYFYLVYIFRYIEILETSQNIMHSSASQLTTELNEHLTHCQQLKTIIVLDFITVHKGFLFFCSLISIILQNYSSVCVFHCIPRLWPPPRLPRSQHVHEWQRYVLWRMPPDSPQLRLVRTRGITYLRCFIFRVYTLCRYSVSTEVK